MATITRLRRTAALAATLLVAGSPAVGWADPALTQHQVPPLPKAAEEVIAEVLKE